jgi:hypothetical protein
VPFLGSGGGHFDLVFEFLIFEEFHVEVALLAPIAAGNVPQPGRTTASKPTDAMVKKGCIFLTPNPQNCGLWFQIFRQKVNCNFLTQ